MAEYHVKKVDKDGTMYHHRSFTDEHEAASEAYRLARECDPNQWRFFELLRVTAKTSTALRTYRPPSNPGKDVRIVPQPQ